MSLFLNTSGRGLRARSSPTTYLQGALEVTCPVQKIIDGTSTDVDDTTAEMIAKTRYTNFNHKRFDHSAPMVLLWKW